MGLIKIIMHTYSRCGFIISARGSTLLAQTLDTSICNLWPQKHNTIEENNDCKHFLL